MSAFVFQLLEKLYDMSGHYQLNNISKKNKRKHHDSMMFLIRSDIPCDFPAMRAFECNFTADVS